MNVWMSIRVALRALGANKLRAGLTMLGIIIGVFAVIILVSIGQGLQRLVTDQFASFGSNLMFVISVSPSGELDFENGPSASPIGAVGLSNADAEAIADPFRAPDVLQVSPALQRGAFVVAGGSETDTLLFGATPETADMRNWNVIVGRYLNEADMLSEARVVVMGQTVVDDLFTPDVSPLDQTVRINNVAFKVIGILEEKGSFLGQDNDDIIIIPLTTAQTRLYDARRRDGEPEADIIQVLVADEEAAEAAIQQINAILRERHEIVFHDEDDFRVVTQDEFLAAFGQITGALTAFLGIVAGISLLVGGIGIMNIMLVSVTERTREIGLRKAVGAKRRDILFQFLVEAMSLAVAGGLLGVALGSGGSMAATALVNGLTTVVSIGSVLLATIISALIGVFFGILPAYRAARLNPIDALRYE